MDDNFDSALLMIAVVVAVIAIVNSFEIHEMIVVVAVDYYMH